MSGRLRFISIIIPCKEVDVYTKQCIDYCRKLDYENFEILLLPDNASENIEGVRVIATGCVAPGRKRNIGVANADGEFCAFIDSDAYPSKDWLRNALKYFNDTMVAGVGGPGLTPEADILIQKAGGYVLSSFMVGNLSSRYKTQHSFESDDIHSCNFIARKSVVEEAGGWNEKYWPGEDTLMCLAIKKLGKKLIESSGVVVYHHRRALCRPHLKQVSRFGEHRCFFAKKFPENSLKPTYFFPSLLVLSLFAGVLLSFLFSFFVYIVVLGVAAYLALSLVAAALQVRKVKLILLVWSGMIVTHLVYGVFFLSGLVKRDLKR
ncbi:glycosyltransferase [Candidatus Bathyarchaeota archaeon]|nr:glycosyltransferase [Candidatus Bathyarchaeota archaeon]